MSGVTNMESMFDGADAFNQPLHTWKTGNSESLYSMFYGAAAFNQSIGDWMLNPAVNLNFIFTNSGLDCYHYSETLKGWNANSGTPDGLSLDADGRTYSPGAADARDNLVTTKGWTIAGDAASGTECPATPEPREFITRWDLSRNGSGAEQISFDVTATGPVGYIWQEVSPGTGTGVGIIHDGSVTITGLPAGATIDLYINPANFNSFNMGSGSDPARLLDVSQWGTTAWTSMVYAFYDCANLQISATDVPDLSRVTEMSNMFSGCTILDGPANIGSWDVSNVTSMYSVFEYASSFNQPIGSWNTSGVTDMGYMFSNTTAFNQPIGSWDTQSVENMSQMFYNASSFDQPIGGWDTQNVTDMTYMFSGAVAFNQSIGNWNTQNVMKMHVMFQNASSFNQPIGSWDTRNVENMSQMFEGAGAFDQSLGNWTLNGSVDLSVIFKNSGLSCYNYSETLKGWSANPDTPEELSLDADGRTYSPGAADARNDLVANKGWTIDGDAASATECLPGQVLPEFITRWNLFTTGSGDTQLSFGVTTSGPVSYTWTEVSPGTATGSGTFDGSTATITGLPAGAAIELSISPANFQRIMIDNGPDKDRLVDVSQWGTTAWTSMVNAFYGCANLQISATDVPDLSMVTDMTQMFRECVVLNSPANIGSWNTQNVTNMSEMFHGAAAFDQPIGSWNIQNVIYMYAMFYHAGSFNQPIGGWDTQSVTDMAEMFREAVAFNQDIGDWKTQNVIQMSGMFQNAVAFNQPIGDWKTLNVKSTGNMFEGAIAFNQPIGSWNTQSVINFRRMFRGAIAFNQPIGGWDTQNVDNMSQMFWGASAFNQPVGGWNTQKVFDMNRMFKDAGAFDQSLGNWALNISVNLNEIFINSGLGCYNYSETLKGWRNNPGTPVGRSLNAHGRTYSPSAADARIYLLTAKGWTIEGDAVSDTDSG